MTRKSAEAAGTSRLADDVASKRGGQQMFRRGKWLRHLMALSAFALGTGVGGSVLTVSATTAGASAKPVKLGVVYDGSGPEAGSDLGDEVSLQAWAKWVNAHGGITGRQVDLVAENDTSNPTNTVTATRKILSTGVAAIVPAAATVGGITKIVDAAKVPALGGIEDTLVWGTTPYWFATGTAPAQYTFDIMGQGYPKDKKTAIFYEGGSAAASTTLPVFEAATKADGGTLVGTYAISPTAATYSAECLAAKAAGAQEVLIDTAPSTPIRFSASCATQGFKPQYVGPDQVVDNTSLKTPAMAGTEVAYSNAPYYLDFRSFEASGLLLTRGHLAGPGPAGRG
jgi:branched-chain amino acid transport system substrate-binding protein